MSLYPYKIPYYFGNLKDSLAKLLHGEIVESNYHFHNFLELFYHHPRLVLYGIQNLIKYFNVIWNDRDWDFIYILTILKKKLECVEEHTRRYGYHENDIQDADNIKLCIDLIDKLIEDDYLIDTPYLYCYGIERREKDKKLLFQLLNEHIDEWWE
jgi:hypothetical protein